MKRTVSREDTVATEGGQKASCPHRLVPLCTVLVQRERLLKQRNKQPTKLVDKTANCYNYALHYRDSVGKLPVPQTRRTGTDQAMAQIIYAGGGIGIMVLSYMFYTKGKLNVQSRNFFKPFLCDFIYG